MRPTRRLSLFLLSILTLFLCISPPRLRAWSYENKALQPVSFPPNLQPILTPDQPDLDGDGQPDQIQYADNKIYIYTQSNFITPRWESPAEWQVKQALVTDLNHDTQPELTLLVWRPFEPWPVESYLPHGGRIAEHQNRRGLSCHLVLIGWLGDAFGELWAGSALARPLRSIAAADLDGNGRQEITTLESRYTDPAFLPARSLAVWGWNGFGFDLLARREGAFHQLELLESPTGIVILEH